MTSTNLDEVFRAVANALNENKQGINEADQVHHDHGDNMVDIFNVISTAVEKKKGAPVSTQLKYASKQLEKKVPSGTAQLYAGGLKEASQKFSGKQIDANSALDFVQTLMGAQQTAATPGSDSPVETLLSGLMGGGSQADDGKFDLTDVLQIGMQYLQAKQSGSNDFQALANALLKRTVMGQKEHRSVSGQVVAQTLLEQLSKATR